MRGITYLS